MRAMRLPNYPSPEVKAFGERVNSAMYDASIQSSLGGLGGCKQFDITNFEEDLWPYIKAYLEGNCDSVAITYAAMRTKELEHLNDGWHPRLVYFKDGEPIMHTEVPDDLL